VRQCSFDAPTLGQPTHRLFKSTDTGEEERKIRGALDARGEGLPYSPPIIAPAQQEERANKKNEESLDD